MATARMACDIDQAEERELERSEGRAHNASLDDDGEEQTRCSEPPRSACNTMPDDVTPEELAARPKQPKTARKASAQASYDKTKNKWWPLFLKSAGWKHEEKIVFIDEDGKPRDGTFRQLFIWMYEQDCTMGQFKPMLAWAQAELNRQLSARLLKEMPNYVCQLPGVKERKQEIYTGHRESHMEHMSDLQAAVESDVGYTGMLSMVMACLSLKVPNTTPLFSLQTFYELRTTHQQAARHDDLQPGRRRRRSGTGGSRARARARAGSRSRSHSRSRSCACCRLDGTRFSPPNTSDRRHQRRRRAACSAACATSPACATSAACAAARARTAAAAAVAVGRAAGSTARAAAAAPRGRGAWPAAGRSRPRVGRQVGRHVGRCVLRRARAIRVRHAVMTIGAAGPRPA